MCVLRSVSLGEVACVHVKKCRIRVSEEMCVFVTKSEFGWKFVENCV